MIEFDGIPSGDYESFCWDVDKVTFKRITGNEPEKYDKSYFHKGLYRLYPDVIHKNKCKCRFEIKITEL